MMKEMNVETQKSYDQASADYLKACEEADLIITGAQPIFKLMSIAEKLRVPIVPIMLGATIPTSEFPLFFITEKKWLPGFLNNLTYKIMFAMLWANEKSRINKWRKDALQLPPMKELFSELTRNKTEVLLAFDRFMLPGMKRPHDWVEQYKLTGYLFVPDTPAEAVPEELVKFISSGEAPIYLGLGSMPAPEPQKLIDIAVQVAENLKKRIVLVAGWTEFQLKTELSSDILIIKSVPHDWLLPKCSVIVHHAGVGTCAAVLRSGVPSVPIPVYLDQPHNGTMLHNIGVASQPITFQKLTAPKLVDALNTVLNSNQMRETAKKVASELKVDGVQGALSEIQKIVANSSVFTNN